MEYAHCVILLGCDKRQLTSQGSTVVNSSNFLIFDIRLDFVNIFEYSNTKLIAYIPQRRVAQDRYSTILKRIPKMILKKNLNLKAR